MERNERLKAADKCASKYTNENEARIARAAFMLGCEFEAHGEVVKGIVLETEEDHWRPMEGLEEEISKCAKSDYCPEGLYYADFAHIARHFAECGARHSINWGDVQLLDTFILELSREEKDGADWGDSEKFYTEVLRRFHEFNDKKIPEIVTEWKAKRLKK